MDYDEDALKLEFEDDEFDDAELGPAPAEAELPAPYEWVLVEDDIRMPVVAVNKVAIAFLHRTELAVTLGLHTSSCLASTRQPFKPFARRKA